ncbi:MAG: hypothetical protein ACRDQ4_18075 [Pseudonocardiaceae bacterium]
MLTSIRARRTLAAIAVTALAGLGMTACAGATGSPSGATTAPHHSGMADMPTGDGLAADASGFRFAPVTSRLPAGQSVSFPFRILGADGKPVTTFEPDQTKLMHFYLIRSDLTGFQHVHPSISADGTLTAPLAPAQPGTYRAYTSFVTTDAAGNTVSLVLSQPLTVPGAASVTPLPAASTTTQVDGYTLTLSGDQIMAGVEHPLAITVSKNGQPVTDLQPYLDTYAHLTAFHDNDLAFAHLHPHGAVNGDHGGPALSFAAMLPQAGNWRLFVQFQTAGVLHTAAMTLSVG